MKNILLLPLILLFSLSLNAQKLDKFRIMCIDEINISQYNGQLSQSELKNQIAALGFRYIENGQNKYHQDLIVYDCNSGDIKFTAVFDKNRLVKNFVLYESQDVPSKKINFVKNNESEYVDLTFNYQGQEIPAFPSGKTELFKAGNLVQTILFNKEDVPPIVTNYDTNKMKISEGSGFILGNIQKDWEVKKIGEWKYFDKGQLTSISVYDNNGNETEVKFYSNGTVVKENKFLTNNTVETTLFFGNGNIKETGAQQGNIKIGTWKYFNAKGKLETTVEYSKGMEVQKLAFDDQGNITKKIELKTDNSELPKSLQTLDVVYETTSFYPDSKVKSIGFENESNKVGIFESYSSNGQLSEIKEYDVKGTEINSLEAATYLLMKKKERAIYQELLVAKTTHPLNLSFESEIQSLSDSLKIDFDSLMMNYNYTEYYQQQYSKLSEHTALFGNLSNKIEWYDSFLASAQDFTNEVWSYSHDLYETELFLNKELANLKVRENIAWLEENYTSSKKTLFGKKLIVVNEQKEIYKAIMEELYPAITAEILTSNNKYQVKKIYDDFVYLVKKAANIIEQPDQQFQESLQKTKSTQEKMQLFLSLK